ARFYDGPEKYLPRAAVYKRGRVADEIHEDSGVGQCATGNRRASVQRIQPSEFRIAREQRSEPELRRNIVDGRFADKHSGFATWREQFGAGAATEGSIYFLRLRSRIH